MWEFREESVERARDTGIFIQFRPSGRTVYIAFKKVAKTPVIEIATAQILPNESDIIFPVSTLHKEGCTYHQRFLFPSEIGDLLKDARLSLPYINPIWFSTPVNLLSYGNNLKKRKCEAIELTVVAVSSNPISCARLPHIAPPVKNFQINSENGGALPFWNGRVLEQIFPKNKIK